MWSIIVLCTLNCCGQGPDSSTPAPPESVVAELSEGLQTGSLIFSSGDCLAIKIFSQSAYTHVGGVVVTNGKAVVYDSMSGAGVRKTPFAEYLRLQTPSKVHLVHPRAALSAGKAAALERYLESQLGRKYAVKHHLTGHRCDGLHCSEYLTDALMAAEMMSAKQPAKVSPGSLLEGVLAANVYGEGNLVELKVIDTPQPADRRWYERAWHSTTTCCSKSATQVRRWVLCR